MVIPLRTKNLDAGAVERDGGLGVPSIGIVGVVIGVIPYLGVRVNPRSIVRYPGRTIWHCRTIQMACQQRSGSPLNVMLRTGKAGDGHFSSQEGRKSTSGKPRPR
jgi:hypothetical protein